MLPKVPKACVESKVTRYIVGGKFFRVPIHHDILRDDYWIYNEELDGNVQMNGCRLRFVKFEQLPTAEEAQLLEWRTLDLMNNIYYSHTTRADEIWDLKEAFTSKKLDVHVMLELAEKYGNEEARLALREAMELSGVLNVGSDDTSTQCVSMK